MLRSWDKTCIEMIIEQGKHLFKTNEGSRYLFTVVCFSSREIFSRQKAEEG